MEWYGVVSSKLIQLRAVARAFLKLIKEYVWIWKMAPEVL